MIHNLRETWLDWCMKSARPSEWLNIFINLAAFILWGACLYVASHSNVWWQKLLAVVVFSYVANTIFAFLHEAVHRVYSWKPWLNETMGFRSTMSLNSSIANLKPERFQMFSRVSYSLKTSYPIHGTRTLIINSIFHWWKIQPGQLLPRKSFN